MRDEFGKQLLKLTLENDNIYAIDGDLAASTRLSYIKDKNPSKFIQAGIAEQNMIGVAAGMATNGLSPWVCTFSTFLTKRALDQIAVSIAQPKLNVKLVGSYSGILNSKLGKSHQSIEDLAIMQSLPNMNIFSPADKYELVEIMKYVNQFKEPVYIRLSRESNNLFNKKYKLEPIKKLNKGEDILFVSTGSHSYYVNNVVNRLKKIGINFGHIHIPFIKPFPIMSFLNEAKKYKKIITVEDHNIIGGFGSTVASIIAEHNPMFVHKIGIKDVNIEAGNDDELLDKYDLSEEYIYYFALNKLKETF